jgi:hypothetical protein
MYPLSNMWHINCIFYLGHFSADVNSFALADVRNCRYSPQRSYLLNYDSDEEMKSSCKVAALCNNVFSSIGDKIVELLVRDRATGDRFPEGAGFLSSQQYPNLLWSQFDSLYDWRRLLLYSRQEGARSMGCWGKPRYISSKISCLRAQNRSCSFPNT